MSSCPEEAQLNVNGLAQEVLAGRKQESFIHLKEFLCSVNRHFETFGHLCSYGNFFADNWLGSRNPHSAQTAFSPKK